MESERGQRSAERLAKQICSLANSRSQRSATTSITQNRSEQHTHTHTHCTCMCRLQETAETSAPEHINMNLLCNITFDHFSASLCFWCSFISSLRAGGQMLMFRLERSVIKKIRVFCGGASSSAVNIISVSLLILRYDINSKCQREEEQHREPLTVTHRKTISTH